MSRRIPARPGPQRLLRPPGIGQHNAPQSPAALPNPAEFASPGESQSMTLVPYGSTHLRLTTLPVIPAGPAHSTRPAAPAPTTPLTSIP